MDHYANDRGALEQQQLIGQEKVIVQNHLIQYCKRKGVGPIVQPGMSINCLVSIYLIDGTPLASGDQIKKYLYGRKRLIPGLQIGFKGARKGDKFRLVISPQYAYDAQNTMKYIPPKSKLIFDIEIISLVKNHINNMTDLQLYYQVYHYIDLSQKYLRKKDELRAIDYLSAAFVYSRRIRSHRCNLATKILLKWGNIHRHRLQFEQALAVVHQIDRSSCLFLEDTLRLNFRLLQDMERKEQLEILVNNTYNSNMQNNQIKRLCVNYWKQTQNWQKLHKLQGYNFKKDKFIDIPKPERQYFHGNNRFMNFMF